METAVIITNMEKKPFDCSACPLCNEYDECQALPWHQTGNWDEQYERCPLKEVKVRKVKKGEVK